ncbi:MAG: tripartite tricarboxylate transporter substrate binding protein [Burkholderiales bacterium]|nr:tripartite tricarboxylate transporter substrate binding protein [Burkholderiales bacterium]
MNKRLFSISRGIFVTLLAATAWGTSWANGPATDAIQKYPTKPISLIVPFPPGAVGDVMARIVGVELAKELRQPVVVENKAGANGNIGAAQVARAEPDGYTLLMGYLGTLLINPSLIKKMPFDSLQDLTPITTVVELPLMVFENSSVPARNLKELVEYARARPDAVTFGAGMGTVGHLVGSLFSVRNGLKLNFIPHKNSSHAALELAAGRIDLMFDTPSNLGGFMQQGKVRALAITAEKRLAEYPDVPTVVEEGHPELVARSWFGLFGPKALPPEIAMFLNRKVAEIIMRPDITERLRKAGLQPFVSPTPQAFAESMRADLPKWAERVKASGVEAQ